MGANIAAPRAFPSLSGVPKRDAARHQQYYQVTSPSNSRGVYRVHSHLRGFRGCQVHALAPPSSSPYGVRTCGTPSVQRPSAIVRPRIVRKEGCVSVHEDALLSLAERAFNASRGAVLDFVEPRASRTRARGGAATLRCVHGHWFR